MSSNLLSLRETKRALALLSRMLTCRGRVLRVVWCALFSHSCSNAVSIGVRFGRQSGMRQHALAEL